MKIRVKGQIKILGEKILPISSVAPWKNNPRKNEHAVEPLAKIIKIHGQVSPIVVWEKDMTIYKGNTTWKAMKSLGLKEIRCLLVSFPSETAAAAYAIADNKSGEWSQWDDEILTKLMQTIDDFETTGITQDENSFLFMQADFDKIKNINAKNSGIKDKIIIMVLDAAKKEEVKEMLILWLKSKNILGVEVK